MKIAIIRAQMKKITLAKNKWVGIALVVLIAVSAVVFLLPRFSNNLSSIDLTKPSEESFQAPGKDWPSEKKVEDYFIEHLRMSPEEANAIRSKPGVDGKVMLRLREGTTLEALLSNLEYYGLVRNKETLRYALEHSKDTVPGHANAIKVGDNTIDVWAYYRISENMTAWEVADELLNKPTYFGFDEYNYLFMP